MPDELDYAPEFGEKMPNYVLARNRALLLGDIARRHSLSDSRPLLSKEEIVRRLFGKPFY